jgi:chromosome segregation ATPase
MAKNKNNQTAGIEELIEQVSATPESLAQYVQEAEAAKAELAQANETIEDLMEKLQSSKEAAKAGSNTIKHGNVLYNIVTPCFYSEGKKINLLESPSKAEIETAIAGGNLKAKGE